MPAVHNGENGAQRLNWVGIRGRWNETPAGPVYKGSDSPPGLIVSNQPLQNGTCRVAIRVAGGNRESAGVVIGYSADERPYAYAELGGWGRAYSLAESRVNSLSLLKGVGTRDILVPDREYQLELRLKGQEVRVLVDDVPVIDTRLPNPLTGKYVGLIGFGEGPTPFTGFQVHDERPLLFVAMAYEEPFETLYKEVIEKQAEAAGYLAHKIDEKPGPGVIFQDMQQAIERAAVVIAEITPSNPNVFYEIGFAHALGKPTILLARRGSDLPFDISSYRVVFYGDTIAGKPEVERSLRRHLDAIADR